MAEIAPLACRLVTILKLIKPVACSPTSWASLCLKTKLTVVPTFCSNPLLQSKENSSWMMS